MVPAKIKIVQASPLSVLIEFGPVSLNLVDPGVADQIE
jgi:hypothetical protein